MLKDRTFFVVVCWSLVWKMSGEWCL